MLNQSIFFGVFVTLILYEFGVFLQKKFKLDWLNPIITSLLLVVLVLIILKIDYKTYNDGAKLISYMLTPATVCLAVPLYERLNELKKNALAIIIGILSGVITSGVCVWIVTMLFSLEKEIYFSFLPKSVTTAIGLGITNVLGGIESLTAITIIVTGIFGNAVCVFVLRKLHITEPVARGVAIGTSSHACGTAKALEMSKTEGAISGLATAVSGLITVVVAPLFAYLL